MDAQKNKKRQKSFSFKLDIKHIFYAIFGILLLVSVLLSTQEFGKIAPEKSVSTLISDIKQKKIKKIEIVENKILAYYQDDSLATVNKEQGESFIRTLQESDVDPTKLDISVKNNDTMSMVIGGLLQLIPTLIIIAAFIFIFRQARGAQESVFSFGQAKSKRYNKEMSKTTFKDIAGVEEAKKELEEIVDFLKNPQRYAKLGARSPKGVLLVGPAGTGKTLLAKAVAGEANVPFFSIAGSEFMEMLVGIGAARVRDLFAVAKKNGPSIIFIDEIDAIGRARSSGVMPGHDEREQTLNQILVEMDGFERNDRVIVIAATNRGDLLDSALLRPGRFDRRVLLDYPDVEGRKAILAIHAKGKPIDDAVNWEKVAKRTVGFSGADIENMLNEAAIHTARQKKEKIGMDELEEAATKVKLGPEKKRLQSDHDREITAYHEAGHAIVTHFQPDMDPVHRISIVSRGMSLGFTLIPPSADRLHMTKSHLIKTIASMMGGRAAEELIFNEITTGAANDFDQSTSIARSMVVDFGMSDLGPINFGATTDVTQWGHGWHDNQISESMMAKIDEEMAKILHEGYTTAMKVLKKHKKELAAVATALLEKESLDEDDFRALIEKK
ncbi:MAG: ATP-dependent zinc metalloprotease FtsH [Microgenomates bacterium OLB22]|nr:MAG: ATP-dependent zinc metalloprotease FtsH [Microgenomates bacterium OLB22]